MVEDRDSTLFIFIPVKDRFSTVDIETLPVRIAVVPGSSRPTDADYLPATWVTSGGDLYAHLLQGPQASLDLDAGEWNVFIAIDAPPEYLRNKAGPLILA